MDYEIDLWIYDDHCGNGYFVSDRELSYDELYCETCNDSDQLVFCGSLWELKKQVRQDICMLKTAREYLKNRRW